MSTLPIEKARTSRALDPKRGAPNPQRQGGARSRPLRSSPRNRRGLVCRSPSEPKADEPNLERVTKQERFDRKHFVPARAEREFVVGDHISASLGFGEVCEPHRWHGLDTEKLRGAPEREP